jgi:hypothetical protein
LSVSAISVPKHQIVIRQHFVALRGNKPSDGRLLFVTVFQNNENFLESPSAIRVLSIRQS